MLCVDLFLCCAQCFPAAVCSRANLPPSTVQFNRRQQHGRLEPKQAWPTIKRTRHTLSALFRSCGGVLSCGRIQQLQGRFDGRWSKECKEQHRPVAELRLCVAGLSQAQDSVLEKMNDNDVLRAVHFQQATALSKNELHVVSRFSLCNFVPLGQQESAIVCQSQVTIV